MTTSSGTSSIEALLNPATNRPAFRNDTSVSAERGLQFEKQLSDAQEQSNSQRALQRQTAAERAAQDAARRRTATEREQADAVAEERDADKRAADKKAAERAAAAKATQQEALAKSILKTGEQGAQVDLNTEQTYHAVEAASTTDTDPAGETGTVDATKAKADAAGQMSALAQVLAAEATAAKRIAEAMAGDKATAAAKLPTVTSIETTSGPDGIHTRLSIELALGSAAGTTGPDAAAGTPGSGLNANAVAALTGEQNAVLAALLGLNTDASVDSASGVKGLTGAAGAVTGSVGATDPGAVPTLPDGTSISMTGAAGLTGSTGATTSSGSAADAAAQVAGAAAAGITQTGAQNTTSSPDQVTSPVLGQATGADAGASATSDANSQAAQAAMSTYVPDKIMVNGQWMRGADWAAMQDAQNNSTAGVAGATAGAQAGAAAGALTDSRDDDSDAQSSTGADATTGTTGKADSSPSTPTPDAFSSLIGQAQPTQQVDQPNAVTGSGYSTAAGESVAEQVGQQLAAQLRAVRDGHHRAVIHLSPEDLGDVTVTLNVHRGDVQLNLIAAPAALTQLQAGLNDLRDQMSQAGLNLGDVSLQQSMDAGASMAGGGGSSAGNQPNYSSGGAVSGASTIPATSTSTPVTGSISAENDLDVLI